MRYFPDLVQFVGLVLLLAGVFLLCGLGWTLAIGGLVTTLWGAVLEWAAQRYPAPRGDA